MHTAPVIQSLWIGDALTAMEQLSIASFLQQGHPYHLYAYDEVRCVPPGAEMRDAAAVLPRNRIFKYREFDSYAGFSNLFRYALLLDRGGYWVDTDVVCLQPFPGGAADLVAGEKVRRRFYSLKRRSAVASCVIRTTPGSALSAYCFRQADSRKPEEIGWGETGPRLLAAAVEKLGLRDCVARSEVFCPVNWWEWDRAIAATPPRGWEAWTTRGTCGVHLWNEIWRREGVDKNGSFPATSLYAQLQRRGLAACRT